MVSLEQLEAINQPVGDWPLLPADRALMHLPALRLTAPAVRALLHGQLVHGAAGGAALWRLYGADECFLGLGESDAADVLRARRLFNSARQQPVAG
jgi:hypothetical protein